MQNERELSPATQLAYERTSLAYDRTLMAWIRTAVSLISFGFTLYKFFQIEFKGKSMHGQLVGPGEFGTLMIVTGLFALGASAMQYRWDRKSLLAQCPDLPRSMAGVVAGMISVLGLIALVAVLCRV
ncbi:MAG: DUF202 domain-containing protein [Armatimonadota bacterium]